MTEHEGNATPAAADDVKRVDADTQQNANPGAAVDSQGVGSNPTESTDTAENTDPKSGGTPVHPSPGADSQAGGGDAEGSGEEA